MHQTLQDAFHIEKFRPKQLSAINASLKGHDVILIMPTGGGKSLCYQLPALISDGINCEVILSLTFLFSTISYDFFLTGITLVVTPLVSLMEDQLGALQRLGIEAAKLNASSSKEEVKQVLAVISSH